jgi:MraZ protein
VVNIYITFTGNYPFSPMVTFIGDFECKTDDKGRIVLPSAFKKAVGKEELRFVVKKHLFHNCLVMYLYSHWEDELIRLRDTTTFYSEKHSRFLRGFFRGLADITLDGNGRFLIPRRLMDQIGAGKEVVLIGIDRYIELWDRQAYDAMADDQDDLAQLAESIMGRGSANVD